MWRPAPTVYTAAEPSAGVGGGPACGPGTVLGGRRGPGLDVRWQPTKRKETEKAKAQSTRSRRSGQRKPLLPLSHPLVPSTRRGEPARLTVVPAEVARHDVDAGEDAQGDAHAGRDRGRDARRHHGAAAAGRVDDGAHLARRRGHEVQGRRGGHGVGWVGGDDEGEERERARLVGGRTETMLGGGATRGEKRETEGEQACSPLASAPWWPRFQLYAAGGQVGNLVDAAWPTRVCSIRVLRASRRPEAGPRPLTRHGGAQHEGKNGGRGGTRLSPPPQSPFQQRQLRERAADLARDDRGQTVDPRIAHVESSRAVPGGASARRSCGASAPPPLSLPFPPPTPTRMPVSRPGARRRKLRGPRTRSRAEIKARATGHGARPPAGGPEQAVAGIEAEDPTSRHARERSRGIAMGDGKGGGIWPSVGAEQRDGRREAASS